MDTLENYAFISYKRKNNRSEEFKQDEKWAGVIKNGLQNLTIPPCIPSKDRIGNSNKIKPIFWDKESMPGGGNLPDRLQKGLESSKTLVLVVSKDMILDQQRKEMEGDSAWIFKEVEYFKRLQRPIIPICVDGNDEFCRDSLKNRFSDEWSYVSVSQIKDQIPNIRLLVEQDAVWQIAAGVLDQNNRQKIIDYHKRRTIRNYFCLFTFICISAFLFIYLSGQNKMAGAFRTLDKSIAAYNAQDLQGARILALDAYRQKPKLPEVQRQMYRLEEDTYGKPYAMIPYAAVISDDGEELLHYDGNSLVIRRVEDLSIVDQFKDNITTACRVFFSGDRNRIAIYKNDSTKVYDRSMRKYVAMIPHKNYLILSGGETDYVNFDGSRWLSDRTSRGFLDIDVNKNQVDTIKLSGSVKLYPTNSDSIVKVSEYDSTNASLKIYQYDLNTRELSTLDTYTFEESPKEWLYDSPLHLLVFSTRSGIELYDFRDTSIVISEYRTDGQEKCILGFAEGDMFAITDMAAGCVDYYNTSGENVKDIRFDNTIPFDLAHNNYICFRNDEDLIVYDNHNYMVKEIYKLPDSDYQLTDVYVDEDILIAYYGFNHRYLTDDEGRVGLYNRQKDVDKQFFYFPDDGRYLEVAKQRINCYRGEKLLWECQCDYPIDQDLFSPERTRLVVRTSHKDFCVIDTKTGRIYNRIRNAKFDKFLNEDIFIFSSLNYQDAKIIYNSSTDRYINEDKVVWLDQWEHNDKASLEDLIAYSSHRCAYISQGVLRVVDTSSGEEIFQYSIRSSNNDGNRVLLSTDGSVALALSFRKYAPSVTQSSVTLVDFNDSSADKFDLDFSVRNGMITEGNTYALLIGLEHIAMLNIERKQIEKVIKVPDYIDYRYGLMESFKNEIIIPILGRKNPYILDLQKKELFLSEYDSGSIESVGRYVQIGSMMYDKNSKDIVAITDGYPVFAKGDTIVLNNNDRGERMVKLRSIDEVKQHFMKIIGERELSEREIRNYSSM